MSINSDKSENFAINKNPICYGIMSSDELATNWNDAPINYFEGPIEEANRYRT